MTRRVLETVSAVGLAIVLIVAMALVIGPHLAPPTDEPLAGTSVPASPVMAGCFDPGQSTGPVVFTNHEGPPTAETPDGYPLVEAARELPTFGGVWVDDFRREIHIALTCDVDGAIAQIGHLVARNQELHLHLVRYTYAELERASDRIFADHDLLRAEGLFISYGGIDERGNRVEIGIDPLDDAIAADLRLRYGEALQFVHAPRPQAPATAPPGGREIVEAVARAPDAEPMVSCGGRPFPASLLEDPDAEGVPDDMVEDFAAVVQFWRSEFPGLERLRWRMAHRDDSSAEFIARRDSGWVSLTLEHDGGGWTPAGAGECRPEPATEGAGRATWWLDPAYAAPGPEATELHILVMEQACASGQPAFGRITAPQAVYTADTLTLTVSVHTVGGTCPSNPPTPATVVLPQPLGERALLDGGRHPPAPPAPDL